MQNTLSSKQTCTSCRSRKVKCDGEEPCGPCNASRRAPHCIYAPLVDMRRRETLKKGEACIPCRSKKKKCDGARPRCTTCRRARTAKECVYESSEYPPQPAISNSSTQAFLRDPTRGAVPSRIASPPVPSFPQPSPSQAVVRRSVPVRYKFVHVTPRATMFTVPFRLADLIDPDALPLSDSTTSELSMKFCILALSHRLQLGLPLTFAKRHAIALGDISNATTHRFFVYFMTVFGCHLDQERRRNFDLLHVQASLMQLCLEIVLTIKEADDPFSLLQVLCFMASACFYTYTYIPAERYIERAIGIAKRNDIRMVDRSFSNSSDSPNQSAILDPPSEYLESVQERVATLVQLIFMPLQYRLLNGKDIPGSSYLCDQFTSELPLAYPRIWDEMPEVLRLRALLLVDETDKSIRTYNMPSCPVGDWLKGFREVLPQLTDLNDLLVKRSEEVAALPDRAAYLIFRCCSIFVLASLAQLYDIFAQCPNTPPDGFIQFRGLCNGTLKDIATITVDFTEDDYSFLEPALTMSWERASSLVVVEEGTGSSPASASTRSSVSPDPENLPSLARMFLDAKSNLQNTIRLTPDGMGVSVVHSMIAVKPVRHDPATPDLLSEDVRLRHGL